MNPQDYMDATQRTLSTQFHGKKVRRSSLYLALIGAVSAGKGLDTIKKALYAGKGTDVPVNEEHLVLPDHIDPVALHMAIGMVTEAAEVAELYLNAIFHDQQPIEPIKLVDEGGDGLWYYSHHLRLAGSSFAEAMRKNIAKLRARFPEKFTSERALNRDLNAEAQALNS
jgi:hypothetical protein